MSVSYIVIAIALVDVDSTSSTTSPRMMFVYFEQNSLQDVYGYELDQ